MYFRLVVYSKRGYKQSADSFCCACGHYVRTNQVKHQISVYKNIKELLKEINYERYIWDVHGDFKMLGLLLGRHGGHTKHSCSLYLGDSRESDQHYVKGNGQPENN